MPDPSLLPSLGAVLTQVTSAPTTGSYLDDPVLPALADALRQDWPHPASSLAVVDGAMDAMDLIVRTTLRFGDRVVVEDPGFPPLVDLLESVGAQLVGVPLDDEGLALGPLEEALREPAAAVFLQPRAQNPVGVTMSAARARAMAALLEGTDTLVVEDDSAAGLSAETLVSLAQWRPDHTAYIRSFSKSHGPDLRLAALSAPPALHRAVTTRRSWARAGPAGCCSRCSWACSPATRRARRWPTHRPRMPRGGPTSSTPSPRGAWRCRAPRASTSGCRAGRDGRGRALASRGIGVAAGAPFRVGPPDGGSTGGHVRVTVGVATRDLSGLADALADAALAGGRPGLAR